MFKSLNKCKCIPCAKHGVYLSSAWGAAQPVLSNVISRNFLDMARNFLDGSRKSLDISKMFLAMSRNFLDMSKNFQDTF